MTCGNGHYSHVSDEEMRGPPLLGRELCSRKQLVCVVGVLCFEPTDPKDLEEYVTRADARWPVGARAARWHAGDSCRDVLVLGPLRLP